MKKYVNLYGLVVATHVFLFACAILMPSPTPPGTPKIEHEWTMHNDIRQDPYHWLRNKNDPVVLEYLEAENDYTASVMGEFNNLTEELYAEMRTRQNDDDTTIPYRMGKYEYWSKTVPRKSYKQKFRQKLNRISEPELVLDLNVLAKGHDHFSFGSYEVSPDGRYLAYSYDTNGNEHYILRVRDLFTGQDLPTRITDIRSVRWLNDNKTLYYTTLDSSNRSYRLYRHTLDSNLFQDILVFEESDPGFYLYLDRTTDGNFLLLRSQKGSTTEIYTIDANNPQSPVTLLLARQHDVHYSLTHAEDTFYILSNLKEPNYAVYALTRGDTSMSRAKMVIPANHSSKIEQFQIYNNYMVVTRRSAGQRRISIIDRISGSERLVPFIDPVYSVYSYGNYEYDTESYRILYTSLTRPNTIIDINLSSLEQTIRKTEFAGPEFDPANYISEQIHAIAEDGTEIPISLVYRKELRKTTGNPTLIYGYGAYGISIDPVFNNNNLSLLDRGYVYAIAHVRGGGYLGDEWYAGGRFENKTNSFTDFIRCTKHLVESGYSDPERIAIEGGSAGGLLVGTVANLHPEMYQAVLARVPWVDVLNDLLDLSLPGTPYEHNHLGDPREEAFYTIIKSYTPYENIRSQPYPHILATAGINDPRVFFWEPAKWIARIRDLNTGDSIQMLKVDLGGGHHVGHAIDANIRKRAEELAFILSFNE